MKKFILGTLIVASSSCRIADFTLVSSKNVDLKQDYVLKSRCTARASTMKGAVDKCIEKGGGSYATNVVIYRTMFRYKVVGDVYGK